MRKNALVILADGFEELEAVTPIDFLRRAGVEVTVAGLDKKEVVGNGSLRIVCDCLLSEVSQAPNALILPGGKKGAERLRDSKLVSEWIQKTAQVGNLVAAICASPAVVLLPSGILKGKKATCYPGFQISFGSSTAYLEEAVVVDGNVLTSRGPGTAGQFAYEIARVLVGDDIAKKVADAMIMRLL